MQIPRRHILAACLAIAAPAALAQRAAFPGGEWVVAAMGNLPVSAPARADITFTDAGRAHGRSFCNRFTGGFTLDGATLRFGPAAGTRMACEAPAMDLEQRFHLALEAVRGWRLDGEALLLTDEAGAPVLRLVRG